MILYQCETVYQLLGIIVHKENYRNQEKAILMIKKRVLLDLPPLENFYSIFEDVCVYPTFPVSRPINEDKVINEGGRYFENICGINVRDFTEIYCACPQMEFPMYLVLQGIHYNYMEDSSGHFFLGRHNLMMYYYKNELPYWDMLNKLGTLLGTSECIDKIYARPIDGYEAEDLRLVPFVMEDELRKLKPDTVEKINQVFGVKAQEVPKGDHALLLTQWGSRWGYLSIEEEQRLYTLLVDYFVPGKKICIKNHPKDLVVHNNVFYDSYFYPRTFPVELIEYGKNSDKITMVTMNSMSRYGYGKSLVMRKLLSLQKTFLYHFHKYYAMKEIYYSLEKIYGYVFCTGSEVETDFFDCWEINIVKDMQLIEKEGKIFIPFVDYDIDKRENIPFAKRILNKDIKHYFVFTDICDDMLDIMACINGKLHAKRIVRHLNNGESIEEFVYIITNDDVAQKTIDNLTYKVDLKYTKESVGMDIMTEQEAEIAILKGILEATEQRLKKVTQENEELKGMLETEKYPQAKRA